MKVELLKKVRSEFRVEKRNDEGRIVYVRTFWWNGYEDWDYIRQVKSNARCLMINRAIQLYKPPKGVIIV